VKTEEVDGDTSSGAAATVAAAPILKKDEEEDSDYESDEEDPWAPVAVPYFEAPQSSPNLWASSPSVDEESDLFFMQLPTLLPPLAQERLRTDRPGGLMSTPSTPGGVGGAQQQRHGNAATAGRNLGDGGAAVVSNMRAGSGSHTQGALGEVSQGYFGTVKVHASGRCVLHLGSSEYELTQGAHCSFVQQAVVVRPGGHPISDAGLRAKQEARQAAESAAAAVFKATCTPEFDDDFGNESSSAGGGDMGQAQSAQAAAAALAAANVRKTLDLKDEAQPTNYTILGPITRRIVAVPVLPTALSE